MATASKTTNKPANKTASAGGKGGSKPTEEPNTAPKAETPATEGEKPKRKQNRRARTYTIERECSVLNPSVVQSITEQISKALGELVDSGKPVAKDRAEAVIGALPNALGEHTETIWRKEAEVAGMAAGDKWLAENAENGVQYRISVVTDPISYEVETKQVRVQKL